MSDLSGPFIYIHGGRSLTFELREVEKEGEEEVVRKMEGEVVVKEGQTEVEWAGGRGWRVSEGENNGDARGWGCWDSGHGGIL